MPGANASTVRAAHTTPTGQPATVPAEGVFELLVVTEEGERHILTPTAAEAPALFARVNASPVLLSDSEN